MDSNNERQPSPQPPDDVAAANIGAKTPPTMNNGGMQDRSPRLTEIEVMSIILTPALTFLANGTSYIRQLSALSNN